MKDNHNQNESLIESSMKHEIISDLKDEKNLINDEFNDELLNENPMENEIISELKGEKN